MLNVSLLFVTEMHVCDGGRLCEDDKDDEQEAHMSGK